MILTPLDKILTLAEGETVEYVRGQITKIDPQVSGKSAAAADPTTAKPFTCQRVHITQGPTTVMVKFWDRHEFSQDLIGKVFHIYATPGQGGKLAGIRTKSEANRDGRKIYLNCSELAQFDFQGPTGEITEAATAKPSQTNLANLQIDPAKSSGDSFDSFEVQKPAAKPAASSSAASTAQKPADSQSQSQTRNEKRSAQPGARVGMAMNLACANLTQRGLPLDSKNVTQIASNLLRVAEWLEAGNMMPKQEETK